MKNLYAHPIFLDYDVSATHLNYSSLLDDNALAYANAASLSSKTSSLSFRYYHDDLDELWASLSSKVRDFLRLQLKKVGKYILVRYRNNQLCLFHLFQWWISADIQAFNKRGCRDFCRNLCVWNWRSELVTNFCFCSITLLYGECYRSLERSDLRLH